MAATLIAQAVAGNVGGAGSATNTSSAVDTTGAALLVGVSAYYTAGGGSVVPSDSKSNVWTFLTPRGSNASGTVRICYCLAPTVGTGHTFTITSGNAFAGGVFAAFSATGPLDINNGASGLQPGSATPVNAGELIIAGLGAGVAGTTYTIDSGFTVAAQFAWLSGAYGIGLAYLNQGAATAVNPAWSGETSGSANAAMASFQLPSAAAAGNFFSFL